jgi:hypothetical protein
LLSKIKGSKKEDQALMDRKIIVLEIPDFEQGRIILVKIVSLLAPSIDADSSIALGIPSNTPFSKYVAKGVCVATYTKPRTQCLFNNPTCEKNRNKGMQITTSLII